MTIQGAIYELNNMLSSNDIPCYWKPAIKKIIETVEQNVGEISEQTDGDLISRQAVIDNIKTRLWQTALNNDEYITSYAKVCEDIADNRIDTWVNEVPSAKMKGAEE